MQLKESAQLVNKLKESQRESEHYDPSHCSKCFYFAFLSKGNKDFSFEQERKKKGCSVAPDYEDTCPTGEATHKQALCVYTDHCLCSVKKYNNKNNRKQKNLKREKENMKIISKKKISFLPCPHISPKRNSFAFCALFLIL